MIWNLFATNRRKRIAGIILIWLGLFFPTLGYLFADCPGGANMRVLLATNHAQCFFPVTYFQIGFLPYKYMLAFGLCLVFAGFGIFGWLWIDSID